MQDRFEGCKLLRPGHCVNKRVNFILYLTPSKDCRRKIKETLSEVERATGLPDVMFDFSSGPSLASPLQTY